MLLIYRVDKSTRTGIDVFQMPDNYQIQDGDFTELPSGLTPYKVVDGQLVASNEAEHEVAESAWFKAHPEDAPLITNSKPEPSQAQKANAALMMQMMQLAQNQQAQIMKQNKQDALIMKQLMSIQMKINGGK